jgi:hypothetical protein
VVLSEGLWRSQFGADSAVLGRKVNLSGVPYTIVGVAPAALSFPGHADVWLPVGFGVGRADMRDSHSLDVVGRLRDGATVEQAREEFAAISRALGREYPATDRGWSVKITSLEEVSFGGVRTALLLLSGAVAFVLLIACANVANLFLARAATRQRGIAIRSALGRKPLAAGTSGAGGGAHPGVRGRTAGSPDGELGHRRPAGARAARDSAAP